MSTDDPHLRRNMSSNECSFCGQDHGPPTMVEFLGTKMPVRECPNLPSHWLALGPDAVDGSLVIADTNPQPTGDAS